MDEEVSRTKRRERRASVKKEFEDVVFSFWRKPGESHVNLFFLAAACVDRTGKRGLRSQHA